MLDFVLALNYFSCRRFGHAMQSRAVAADFLVFFEDTETVIARGIDIDVGDLGWFPWGEL